MRRKLHRLETCMACRWRAFSAMACRSFLTCTVTNRRSNRRTWFWWACTMRDIDERGMREVMADALKYAMDDTDGIAVSLDMDFVDPADAPGVGTPMRGGVTYREAHLAMEMIADSEAMVSMEVVEINPVIDEHNRTALLGVELVLSGLGKKIL